MAKGTRVAVPTMEKPPEEVQLQEDLTPGGEAEVETIDRPEVDTLAGLIRGNLAEPTGYRARHVQLHLTTAEAEFLARLRTGLDQGHARLSSGRVVQSLPEALRWLLEKCISC